MKRTIQYILLSLITLLLIVGNLFAQDVKFTASSETVVQVGEKFQLTYTLNARGSSLRPPNFSDFNLLGGPSQSSSSNIQFINGSMSQSITTSYTYYLQAKKAGTFTLASASVVAKKKRYKSNDLQIEVVKGSAPATNKVQNKQASTPKPTNVSGKDLFIRVLASKKNVYQGEHFVATIKLYSKTQPSDISAYNPSAFTGFWKQEIETSSQITLNRENINGQVYYTAILNKYLLFPQKTGVIEIDPASIDVHLRKIKGYRNTFFGRQPVYETFKKPIKSPKVKISVKKLPANAPSDFKGAVGGMKMTAVLDNQNVNVNDAITLKVKISGNGNIKLLEPLDINLPADFELYDPKINTNVKTSASGSYGNKTFEYIMQPRHAGTFTIPPIKFTYFDTGLKKYKTTKSNEYVITVSKGIGDDATTVVSGFSKEDIRYIGEDIRFIKTKDIRLKKKEAFVFGSMMFYLGYIGSLVIFILIYILFRERIKRNANAQLVRNRKANKVSKKRLKAASLYLKEDSKELFYNEILKALWGYLSDKLSIPVSDLTKESTINSLTKHQVDEVLINSLSAIIDECEFARYAPSEGTSQMDHIYTDASKVIGDLEGEIKR